MSAEKNSQSAQRPIARVGGPSVFGLVAFCIWILIGACFSFIFVAADPLLRGLLVIMVLMWAILGPFALSFFVFELGTWFMQKGQYQIALAIAKFGVAIDNAVLPMVNLFGMVDSPLAVLNLLNLASVEMCLCKFQDASVKLEAALDKSQGTLGWDHHLTQIVVGQLAACLIYLGKFEQAEQYFRRAIAAKSVQIQSFAQPSPIDDPTKTKAENLKIKEQIFNREQLPVIAAIAMDRYGLGSLMERKLRFGEAETQYKLAIETIKEFVFEDTDFLANHLNALGELYVKTDRLDEAAECITRAFEIRKEIFPADHLVLASSYHSLGCLRLKQGDFYEAKRYLTDALQIKERLLGTRHPDVADTYRAQGELETALNNFDKAEHFLSRSLEILDQTFGTHPDVSRVLESFSKLYEKSGNKSDAQEFNERADEIRKTLNQN